MTMDGKRRREVLAGLAATQYDVCVIGGGASGAGCALDAQLRGMRTLLLDAGDFGGATSSASTKLIHGGLRYLQQAVTEFDAGQLHVVWIALRERRRMMRNAPHLTRALRFAVPCFSFVQAVYFGIGVKAYDWLSGRASVGASHFSGRAESLRRMPWLKSARLFGTVRYSDGQFDDARYNMALVLSAGAAGGDALNYARVVEFEKSAGGRIVAARVEDQESGNVFRVAARAFVNATGPFSDRLRQLAEPKATGRLRPSKGVHILLPLPEHFGDDALLIPGTDDGRVIFAIPWGGRLLVGTTDTESAADAEMAVTNAEAAFLLRHLNRYLAKPFEIADIVSAMAGLRPLLGSADPRKSSKLARDYEIERDAGSGLISVLGGKWTVYRAMAEDAIDAVERSLIGQATKCRTQDYRLHGYANGTEELSHELTESYAVSAMTARHLVDKFGKGAREVLDLTRQEPMLAALLVEGAPQIRAEVVYAAREEMAICVEDILCRRTGLQFFDWKLAAQAAPVVAEILAAELHWPPARAGEEAQRYARQVERLACQLAPRGIRT